MKKHKRKYLDFKDDTITIFNDDDKLILVFVNDRGNSEVVSYDDNFFYVEYLLDTYLDLLEKSFRGWRNRELDQNDYEEIKVYLKRYYRHLKRQTEVDLQSANDQVRGLLYGKK